MISLDKKNLPSYIYKINLAGVIFFIAWFCLCFPVAITIGCLYDESIITYVVIAIIFALFFIGLAILVVIDKKLQQRLCAERAAELEDKFKDMPLDAAEAILKQNGVIDSSGFICTDNVFGATAVPFSQACFAFGVHVKHTKIVLEIAIGRNGEDKVHAILELDAALYNFLIKSGFDLSGNYIFDLFVNDKKEFAKFALQYSRVFKANFRG